MTRRPPRRLACALALGLVVPLLPLVLAPPVGAVEPTTTNPHPTGGHEIGVFPQRDFVSAAGYAADQTVTVDLIHPDGTTFTAGEGLVPQDDPGTPGFDGIVEVNHPGGYCWQGRTPYTKPGDKVRITVDQTRVADVSTVAWVKAGRPTRVDADTVRVRGTAADRDPRALGATRLPLTELEHRLMAPGGAFDGSGNRTLRTSRPGQGTLVYDGPLPTDLGWTATYDGLTPHDVELALGGESKALWLRTHEGGSVEATHYEVGAGVAHGPDAPCTAPAEVPQGSVLATPTTPLGLVASTQGATVELSWTASSDDVGVTSYGVYRDGQPLFNVQRPDGSAPAPTVHVDRNVPPGTHTYTVDAADDDGFRSAQSAGADATTAAQPAPTGPVNDPPAAPLQLISFPSRDFVSMEGYLATDQVDVQLLRDGQLVSTSLALIPQDDPATPHFDGIVEVNHPGGGCWDGTTPEVRPGDVLRTVAWAPDRTVRSTDQTRTANVTATRARIVRAASTADSRDGVLEVTGTAQGADGRPLPLAQLEQRMVAGGDRFDASGHRTLRASGGGGEGTLSYDATDNPTGTRWTVRYTGLSSDDLHRSVGGTSLSGRTFPGAESRILWLGTEPLAEAELTIFEVGTDDPPGPATGYCTAPLEEPDGTAPHAPSGLTLSRPEGSEPDDVTLTWSAPTPADRWVVAGHRVYRDGALLADVGGSFARPGDRSSAFTPATTFVDRRVPSGTRTYTVLAYDNASPQGEGATAPERLHAGTGRPYGNASAHSAPVSTDQGDVRPPSTPTDLVGRTGALGRVTLTWRASTDDVAVAGYGVHRRPQGGTTWTRLGLSPGGDDVPVTTYEDQPGTGTYEYAVDAADAAANRSPLSAPVVVTVTALPDTTAPAVPEDLTAVVRPDVHGRDVRVSWTPGAANGTAREDGTPTQDVSTYGVYRNGAKVADVAAPATVFDDLALATGTYRYEVDAVDSAGNRSARASVPAAAGPAVVANDPPRAPHSITAFPSRDFVSASGYTPGTVYVVEVVRDGRPSPRHRSTVTADAAGVVEVNHAGGGGCWDETPDLRPGDVVRITDPDGVADQVTVAGVFADRAVVTAVDSTTGGGTLVVRGTAVGADGAPLPVGELEHRFLSAAGDFDLTSRQSMRASTGGPDGSLAYDAPGSPHWTATYVVQTPDDLARAAGGRSTSGTLFTAASSRALWLGRDPLAEVEGTISENGPGIVGGQDGCPGSPSEGSRPAARLSAAPTFADTSPGATSLPQPVTLTNSGDAPLHVERAYLAGLNPQDFTILDDGGAPGATVPAGGSVTVQVAFRPTTEGTRQANLSFTDDAANTTDQTVPLVATTPALTSPSATPPVQSVSAGNDVRVVTPLEQSTLRVGVRWSSTGSRSELEVASGPSTTKLGAFTAVPVTSGATSTEVDLRMGTFAAPLAYQFRVRACGTACSSWVNGPRFTLQPIDDKNVPAGAWKGRWSAATASAGAYGGTVRHASSSAEVGLVDEVSFSVSGNAAWVSTMGPDRGIAEVQVDGGPRQVVDLYSPTVRPARVVWAVDALAPGQHTVTLRVVGKRNSASRGTRVDVDMAALIR